MHQPSASIHKARRDARVPTHSDEKRFCRNDADSAQEYADADMASRIIEPSEAQPLTKRRRVALAGVFHPAWAIDGAIVHPCEVVKEALKHNAAAVILAHKHRSGVAEPSHADELITQRVKAALSLVDIGVLGHVIVAGGDTRSFAERGLL